MRERRAITEATEDSRDSKAANPNQVPEAAVEAQFDLQWGSKSALVENSARASGAHALTSTRDAPKASTRALPPRPGNFPPIPKVSSWSRAAKEAPKPAQAEMTTSTFQEFRSEPPGGSTRAYNHAELERLLSTADCLPSSLPPAPGDMAETAQLDNAIPNDCAQPSAMASWPQPVESLFPQLRDMAHNEDATTAYLKLSPKGMLDETMSLEDRQCWVAASPSERPLETSAAGVAAEALVSPGSISVSKLEVVVASLRRHRTARRRLVRLHKRAQLRRTRLARAIVLLGCLGLSSAIWVASPLGERSRARATLHLASTRLSAWLAPQGTAAEARFVQLDIAAEPTQAQLYLDGHEASNPLKLRYPADTKIHELTARASGYHTRTLRLPFDRGVTVILGLNADSAEPKAAAQ